MNTQIQEAANECAEQEKKWGLDSVRARINFTKGANWDKDKSDKQVLEQSRQIHLLLKQIDADKAIIDELLEALKQIDSIDNFSRDGKIGKILESAITKAEIYLNK